MHRQGLKDAHYNICVLSTLVQLVCTTWSYTIAGKYFPYHNEASSTGLPTNASSRTFLYCQLQWKPLLLDNNCWTPNLWMIFFFCLSKLNGLLSNAFESKYHPKQNADYIYCMCFFLGRTDLLQRGYNPAAQIITCNFFPNLQILSKSAYQVKEPNYFQFIQ